MVMSVVLLNLAGGEKVDDINKLEPEVGALSRRRGFLPDTEES